MARRQIAALVGLGVAVLVASPVLSCTTVCLLEKEKAFVAYTYDFHSADGLILVNKRGVKKVSSVRAQAATLTRSRRRRSAARPSLEPERSTGREARQIG